MPDARSQEIESIIKELEDLRNSPDFQDRLYAIEANIDFYQSLKSIWSYSKWLLKTAPKLDPEKLLEINDLLPKYDETMHKHLIVVEKQGFPGIIAPIVKEVYNEIYKNKDIKILGSTGSGGMELERQVIDKLIKNHELRDLVFVAFDKSEGAHSIARQNLSEYKGIVNFISRDFLSRNELLKISKEKGVHVVFAKNDIFNLKDHFNKKDFDITYNSFFTHHLTQNQHRSLNANLHEISKTSIEYDGYRSIPQLVPQSIFGWKDSILLNGSVISGLRYIDKDLLKKGDVKLFQIGTYVLKYKA